LSFVITGVAMINLLISYRGTVYPWQCDHMGHMNVMWYTGKFDEASWYLMGQAGLTRSFLESKKSGLAAVQPNLMYKRELRAGDVITIRSGILEIQEKAVRIFHEMRNEETHEVAAFTIVTGVYMDAVKRKSCPIPPEIRERIEDLRLNQNELYCEDTLTPDVKSAEMGRAKTN
jgi:acyl-CoA thioester hydrolase